MRIPACIVAAIMKTIPTIADEGANEGGGVPSTGTSTAPHRCPSCPPARCSRPRASCCARWPRRSASRSCCSCSSPSGACTNWSTRSACRSHWSASTCASSSSPAWWPGERSGREVLYRLVDHHLAHIVVDAVAHAAEDPRVTGAGTGVRATRQRAAITDTARRTRRFPVRPGTARRTAAPRRGHRPDHRLPHPAGDVGGRRGRHPAHRHRRVGLPALLGAPPPPPGVPGVRRRPSRSRAGQVETWAADIARRHGFSDVSHTIEIFGVCGGCASTQRE